ncbi:MAG: GAF domain-containing protein [Chloroflexota bacterium]
MVPAEQSLGSLKLLFEISRELTSSLDLRVVLGRVLSLSLQNMEGSNGSIIVLDEQGAALDAAMIVNGQIYEDASKRLKDTLEDGLAGWVLKNRQPALVKDNSKDKRWVSRNYTSSGTPPKSSLCVPLQARDEQVGAITFTHSKKGYFTEEHLALVQAIADQAAIAVLNARLYTDSHRRAEVMEALAQSAASITASLDLDDVLKRILEQVIHALKVEAATLGLVDQASGEVVFRASIGGAGDQVVGMRVKPGQGIAGWVAQSAEAVIVSDAKSDPRHFSEIDEETGYKTKALAAAPILLNEQVIGVIETLNPETAFSQADLVVLKGIGSLAGTAIQHARLFEEAQVAHLRYRNLFERSVDPIFVTNLEGKIIEANNQAIELLGVESQAILHKNIHYFHQVDWKIVGEDFSEMVNGKPLSYESALQPKEGDPIPIEVHLNKIYIESDERMQWILHDISEVRELEDLRQDLSSMIYHDLRSPLGNVVSGLELIRTMVEPDPAVESVIEIANRSVDRVQRLVSSLLDTSRLQSGQGITSKQKTELSQLIIDSIGAIEANLGMGKYKLEMNLSDELLYAMIDADMIRRVIINLLENSMKFSREGSQLEIGVARKEEELQIWVSDQGLGISPEDQEMIFEKFSRSAGVSKLQGLGLGLAFCKLAIEGHGGAIWVESNPGEGSTFTFTLPSAE